jgi:BirA family transcriptional regulator, biotin operon repressor / biotin---[acetyl-CoA-carboxylase] ligase
MSDLVTTAIMAKLNTEFIGRRIVYHPVLPSTMDAARQEARRGATEGTVVIAGEQTRGRGRLKRNWVSPAGSIALSIILYPDTARLPYLIMIASLAAVRSIESLTGVKAGIKWPNDVLIRGKKVGGILIENEVKGRRAVSITGIGINVDVKVDGYQEIAGTAASLESTSGGPLRISLMAALLNEYEALYRQMPDSGSIFESWRERLLTLGQPVTATGADGSIEGVAEDVDETGALIIRTADRKLIKVVAGDVTLRGKL